MGCSPVKESRKKKEEKETLARNALYLAKKKLDTELKDLATAETKSRPMSAGLAASLTAAEKAAEKAKEAKEEAAKKAKADAEKKAKAEADKQAKIAAERKRKAAQAFTPPTAAQRAVMREDARRRSGAQGNEGE